MFKHSEHNTIMIENTVRLIQEIIGKGSDFEERWVFVDFAEKHRKNANSNDIRNILKFLARNGLCVFPRSQNPSNPRRIKEKSQFELEPRAKLITFLKQYKASVPTPNTKRVQEVFNRQLVVPSTAHSSRNIQVKKHLEKNNMSNESISMLIMTGNTGRLIQHLCKGARHYKQDWRFEDFDKAFHKYTNSREAREVLKFLAQQGLCVFPDSKNPSNPRRINGKTQFKLEPKKKFAEFMKQFKALPTEPEGKPVRPFSPPKLARRSLRVLYIVV